MEIVQDIEQFSYMEMSYQPSSDAPPTLPHDCHYLEEGHDIVLISSFYDIGRGSWDSHYKRSSDVYLQAARHYLDYEYEMIIFIDERYFTKFYDMYVESPFQNKTLISINEEWLEKNSFIWRQRARIKEVMESDSYKELTGVRIDGKFPENVAPDYNAITCAKIDFIVYAINNFLTHRQDIHICWSDFGYFNSVFRNDVSKFPTSVLDSKKIIRDRLMFTVRSRIEETDKDMKLTLQNAREVFATSMFCGSRGLMRHFQKLCYMTMNEMLENGVADDDQHLYMRVCILYPELFVLYVDEMNPWPMALRYFQK